MRCKFNGMLRVWIKTLVFLSVNLRPNATTTTGMMLFNLVEILGVGGGGGALVIMHVQN